MSAGKSLGLLLHPSESVQRRDSITFDPPRGTLLRYEAVAAQSAHDNRNEHSTLEKFS
jgi:hypothetical protein